MLFSDESRSDFIKKKKFTYGVLKYNDHLQFVVFGPFWLSKTWLLYDLRYLLSDSTLHVVPDIFY